MTAPILNVLYEDEHLLVINKAAGLVCHPTKGDACSSLVGRVRLYFGSEVRTHLVNRLDRETSGVVVVAKNASTASTLGRLWEQHRVKKEYLAVVKDVPAEEFGVIDAPLGRDLHSDVAIKDCVRMDGAAARTEFRRLVSGSCAYGKFTLLQIFPQTGRKHQIRIHLAHIGHPILGDKLYGGDEQIYLSFVAGKLTSEQLGKLIVPNHALHAKCLRFRWLEREWEFEAEPEAWFKELVADFSNG